MFGSHLSSQALEREVDVTSTFEVVSPSVLTHSRLNNYCILEAEEGN